MSRHLDPTLMNAEAERLERQAEHETNDGAKGLQLFMSNFLRSEAARVRRDQEDLT